MPSPFDEPESEAQPEVTAPQQPEVPAAPPDPIPLTRRCSRRTYVRTLAGGGYSRIRRSWLCCAEHGHANPPSSISCRVCGSPLASQAPQFVPGPVLAVLRASDGSTAELDRPVLIGRAPSRDGPDSRAPRLMTVPSPNHDISRTHLEVAPEGWQIVVTDLNSTNGTVLVRPGAVDRQQLAPGEPVTVQLGSVMELGDGVSVLIDFPQ